MTVIDLIGVIDIPFCNEIEYDTKIAGERTTQASGFFENRPAMAAVYSIGITGCSVLGLRHPSTRHKLLFAIAAGLSLLALFLTHNRSGVLGSILATAIFVVVSNRILLSERLKMILGGSVMGVILLGVAYLLFPEHLDVYFAKLGFLGLAEETWKVTQFASTYSCMR